MLKNFRGITLIALVVTIIILLILAGITIGTLTGDNGIIQKAKQAKIETEIATEKEQVQMSYLACKMEDYQNNVTKQAMQEELDKQVGENKTKVTSRGENLIIEFVESQRVYQIEQNGNITETEKPSGIDDEIGMDGDGTKENPYRIMSIEDLYIFSEMTNTGETFEGKFIELGRDLDFLDNNSYIDPNANISDISEWNYFEGIEGTVKEILSTYFPSIAEEGEFIGFFDGDGHKIKNFTKNEVDLKQQTISTMAEQPVCNSLFYSNQRIIANLELENIEYKLNQSMYVSGICSYNQGIIMNCKISGNLILNEKIYAMNGIVTDNMGTIYNCVNSMDINFTTMLGGSLEFSGICRTNGNSIINCQNETNMTIEKSSGDGYISGIVYNNSGDILGSYNTGSLTLKSTLGSVGIYRVAGIAKENTGGIYASYNLGNLTNTSTENIQQLAIDGSRMSTGIVCENMGRIENCYNAGLLVGERTEGIVNYNGDIIENCYWQTGKSTSGGGDEEDGIYEMTEEEMKNKTFIDTLNNNLKNSTNETIKLGIEFFEMKFVSNPQISPYYPVIEARTITIDDIINSMN